MYKIYDCTDIGVMCTQSVEVEHELDGKKTHINLDNGFSAYINGVYYEDLKTEPFSNGNMYVKTITSLFTVVRGFGFHILYAPLGRVYIIFDPYYLNKVCIDFYQNT